MPEFEVVTLFPEQVAATARMGVTGRALRDGLFRLRTWNPRDFTNDPYRRIDDRPYGGGPGMVMMAGPLLRCLEHIHAMRLDDGKPRLPVVYLSPHGRRFDQTYAAKGARSDGFVFLCGRYEAVDQRLLDRCVDLEWSLGDFVVSGGELPALTVIDAMARLVPGVLNHDESAACDSFATGLLDCPHYTRPEVFSGEAVPDVLLSGNHANIARWRRQQALRLTARSRPDLIESARSDGLFNRDDESYLAGL